VPDQHRTPLASYTGSTQAPNVCLRS
jgi:hypothetical protein